MNKCLLIAKDIFDDDDLVSFKEKRKHHDIRTLHLGPQEKLNIWLLSPAAYAYIHWTHESGKFIKHNCMRPDSVCSLCDSGEVRRTEFYQLVADKYLNFRYFTYSRSLHEQLKKYEFRSLVSIYKEAGNFPNYKTKIILTCLTIQKLRQIGCSMSRTKVVAQNCIKKWSKKEI